jgi:chromosomal replication initiation ATPase DnaA
MKISSSRIHMVSGLVLERMWMTKAVQRTVMSLSCSRLSETGLSIRRQVSEHFYLPEMRDPDLKVRCNRRAHVLPRQIAMYLVRQLTGASLQEIGRQFGGKHHTTVLHSINKIEELRRTDKALDRTITQLIDAVVAQT